MSKIPLICRIRHFFITPARAFAGVMNGCGLGIWKKHRKCVNCPYYNYETEKWARRLK